MALCKLAACLALSSFGKGQILSHKQKNHIKSMAYKVPHGALLVFSLDRLGFVHGSLSACKSFQPSSCVDMPLNVVPHFQNDPWSAF
jgi:hypothetical protein